MNANSIRRSAYSPIYAIKAACLIVATLAVMLAVIPALAQDNTEVRPLAALQNLPLPIPSANLLEVRPPSQSEKRLQLTAVENRGKSLLAQEPSLSQSNSSSSSSSTETLTFGKRARIYGHSVFSPMTIVGPAFGAGIGQWRNEPPEWKQGAAGYGRRFASGLGRHVVSKTITFGVAAADGEDPRFIPSDEQGVWARVKHAVVSTFVSKTPSGARIPALSRFAGAYGSAFVSNAWYPQSRADMSHALIRGSTALASGLGFRILQEFFPRLRGH